MADGNNIPGIGEVLEIDKTTIDNLDKVQSSLTQMAAAAERIAASMGSITVGLTSIQTKLKSSNIEAVFDDSGVMRNFKSVTEIAVKTNQTMQRMSQQTVASEDALTKKWERIMTARADSASTINTRLRQIADYQKAFQLSNAKAIESGGGPLDDTAYKQSIKYADELTKRLKELHLEYDEMAAKKSVEKALTMPDNTAAEAQAKIKAIAEAIAEVNKPGAGATQNAGQNTTWLGQLMAEADATVAKLGKLKEAEKEAKLVAKQTAQYQDLASSYQSIKNLPGDDLEQLEKKLSSFRELYRKVKQAVDKNPLITKVFAEDVLRDIKEVEQQMSHLSALAERNDIRAGLQDAFGGTSRTLDDLKERYKSIAELIERAKKAFDGDGSEASWLSRQVEHAEKLQKSIKGLDISLGLCEKSATKVGGAIKTAFATLAVGTFVKNVVAMRGEFEMAERSLGVIIKDSARAKEMFGEIQKIAIKSPFQVKDLVKQTKQLAAYRIETDKLVETTRMLGDISAGVGVDMQRLILAYGQVKAATFLKGTELRQFSEAGVNMLGGLSDRLSELQGRFVSTGEVMQMVSKRMISFEDVDAVLRAQTRAGGAFYKMQEKQAETIQGKISNIKDRLDIMYNQIGQSSTGAIHAVIDSINWFVSNYELIVGIVSAGAIYKAVTALVGGIYKLTKAMKSLQLIFAATDKSMMGFLLRAGKAAPIIAAVTALTGAIVVMAMEANRANRELKNNGKAAREESDEMVRNYERLAMVISSNARPLKERQDAFNELKATFGNILPLENENVDTIKRGSEAYNEQIALLKEYNAEQLRQKNMQTLIQESDRKMEKAAKTLTDFTRGRIMNSQFAQMFHVDDIDKEDVNAILQKTRENILNGMYSTAKDAAEGFYATLEEYLTGENGGRLWKAALSADEPYFNGMLKQFENFFDLLGKIEKEESKLFPDLRWGAEGKDIRRDIQNIKKEYDKFINQYSGVNGAKTPLGTFDFASNPTLLKAKAEEYVNTLIQEIEKKIKNTPAPETHKDFWLKQLGIARGQLITEKGSIDEALQAFYTEMNTRLAGRGGITFGVGDLLKKPDEDIKTYAQRVRRYFDDADKSLKIHAKVIKNAQDATKKGFWDPQNVSLMSKANDALAETAPLTREAAEALQSVRPIAEAFFGMIEGWITKKESNAAANAYKSSLNDLISTLKGASKEMDSLDRKGQELLEQKIKIIAKRLKIKVPASYADDILEEWVRELRKSNKITEVEMLDILIPMRKDAIADRISEINEEVSGLWDKYNTAKKAEEWGISLGNIDTAGIYSQIIQKEAELREINTQESKKSAEDVKKHRLETLRSEQEEAAKLIYESQKKSLSKTKQAYASMYEDIKNITTKANDPELDTKISKETISAAVNARMVKASKEVAEAQWEAYKGTQNYIMAFGDLDNLGVDVLRALKADLEGFSKLDLKPEDVKAVATALGKINAEIEGGGNKIGSFTEALGGGFKSIAKADRLFNKLPALEAAFFEASAEANKQLREQEAATKEVETALLAVAEAQAEYDEAVRRNNENPTTESWAEQEEAKKNLDDANNRLAESQGKLNEKTDQYAKAAEKADGAAKAVKNAQDSANKALEESGKKLGKLSTAYDAIKESISTTISFVEDLTEAFGGAFSPETKAALDGFTKGIGLVTSAMGVLTSVQTAYKAAVDAGTIATGTFMTVAWPLLAIGAALGVIIAALKMQDAALESTIERHKDNVDDLKRSYDRLSDSLKRALSVSQAYHANANMIKNLKEQVEELNQALAASERRKTTDETKDERKALQKDIEDTERAIIDARNEWLEMMGATSDWAGLQSDWASDWLSAYKETGDGLAALQEQFDKFWENIISEQVARVAFSDLIAKYKEAFTRILADGEVTMEEANEVSAMRRELNEASEKAKRLVQSLGVSATGTMEEGTLQRGVETVTEQTASALEGLLNSTRYYVADTNALMHSISTFFAGEGEDTIMANMKAQTQYLRSLSQIASSVYSGASHPKGAGGIKVFVD